MKNKILLRIAIGLLFIGMSPLTKATTIYNATSDFSITNGNPNGVWSYGWMSNDLSTFNLHSTSRMNGSSPQWSRDNNGDFTPMIWRIDGVNSRYGVAPGQLALHPGSSSEASVLRWTAPTDGIYHIDGQFFSGDSGIMQTGVRQNDNWLWQGVDSGIFTLDASVIAGTSIDFLVYGGYAYGNTPLELIISSSVSVSLASTATLFVAGLGGLISIRRKGKNYEIRKIHES